MNKTQHEKGLFGVILTDGKRLDEYGMEFWSARDMARALEYSEYRHFLPVIEKAKDACKNSKH